MEEAHSSQSSAGVQASSDTSNGAGHASLGGCGGAGIATSSAHGRGPRLYVGGVPDEITEEDIIEHFNKWGNVVDVYFPGKKGAKRVNYCFVTYDNWRSAQRACNQSERNIDGKVTCALAAIFVHACLKTSSLNIQHSHQAMY